MHRAVPLLLIVLAASQSWGYQPGSNITRGIYCDPSAAIATAIWAPFRGAPEYVTDVRIGGAGALLCDNSGGGRGSGAGVSQAVRLNQTEPKPIKIAGWSKAQDVAPGAGYEYSLYVDMVYTDGTPWYMQVAPFKPGTHDWEYSESVVTPEKPVRSASFHAFIREKSGKVWFDDLFFGEVGGENLLRDPGFEPGERVDTQARDKLVSEYLDLNANAMHIYLSPGSPRWESDLLNKHYDGPSPLAEFLEFLKQRGIGVWVTMGSLPQPFDGVDDPRFPAYYCPNEKWGENWVAVMGDIARQDIAGISLVPDEYNYDNRGLKRDFANHRDEAVRAYYEQMPPYCDGPGCRALYQATFGTEMPDLTTVQQTDAWRNYINFRYQTTTEWLRKSAEAVKQANPDCRADSLICVTPVCSDRWWTVGVAWDQVGYGTKIDFLTTDPYILLHNYLGDSTHWYVTETCERLSGAHPLRQCGSVLEASRLRPEHRDLDPVEVYGAAFSSVFHGAKELAWWHHSHITGQTATASDSAFTYATVRAAYQALKEADPWLEGLTPIKRVALLHSRASEDWWRFNTEPEPQPILTHSGKDARYASRAQVEPLMHCLRSAVPVDLYYLESVTAEQLADYPVVVVPFAFAISDRQVEVLRKYATSGGRLVVISEVGTLDEQGKLRDRPALLDLLGLARAPAGEQTGPLTVEPGTGVEWLSPTEEFSVFRSVVLNESARVMARVGDIPVITYRAVGDGAVVYLAGEFGAGLPVDYSNEKRTRTERIYPPKLRPAACEVLLRIYEALFEGSPLREGFEFLSMVSNVQVVYPGAEPPHPDDLEVVAARNARGELICLITNWTSGTARFALEPGGARPTVVELLDGVLVSPDATVRKLDALPRELAPQQSCILRLEFPRP
ncbi:MAG: beta-galactosidase trimerization domain-containing protein [Acidobacteriota bacterium]|nr:beta-galactosidase trimerization domain-containing protein [Acidobacteriota bacterium]